MMQQNHIDTATVKMLVEILEDGFPTLVETFINDSQLRINDIKTGFQRNDAESVRRSAHNLKGSSGNVGATALAELSQSLELAAQSHELNGMAETLGEIETEFVAVKNTLLQYMAELS